MLSIEPQNEIKLIQVWYTEIILHHCLIGVRRFKAITVRQNVGGPITRWRRALPFQKQQVCGNPDLAD